MMRGPLLLPALLAVSSALGFQVTEADAAPATARLESTRAPDATDCPSAAALAASVNEGLGRVALVAAGPTGPAAPAPGRVVVAFERVAKGYAATVRIDGAAGGTRKVSNEGPGCGALASAVEVLLTVVLDSSAEASVEAVASSPPSQRPGGSGSTDATHSQTTADVGVGAGVAQGLVGGWSPALGLGGTLTYQRWAARSGVVWLPAQSNAYGPGRVEVGLALARLALCASPQEDRARFSLELCLQQQVGWMRGSGVDYEAGNRVANHLWLAAGAAIVASGPLGRSVGWEAETGIVGVLRQERFVVENLGTAFQSAPVAFVTTLAFTTRVW